jgi:hypothetical protein
MKDAPLALRHIGGLARRTPMVPWGLLSRGDGGSIRIMPNCRQSWGYNIPMPSESARRKVIASL